MCERFLALSLGVMMGLVAVFVVGYQFIYVPLAAAGTELEQAKKRQHEKEDQLADELAKIKRAEELSPRLAVWELASLPDLDTSMSQTEFIKATQVSYNKELNEIFGAAKGFKLTSIKAGDADVKGGVNQKAADKDKTPVYYNLKFTVEGSSNLEGLLLAMEKFYQAKYLHQIHGFVIKKASQTARRGAGGGGDLQVTMTIDAFIVLGSDKHAAENLADKLKEERTPTLAANKLARDLLLTTKDLAKIKLGDDSKVREILASKKMFETLKDFGTASSLLATKKLPDQIGSFTLKGYIDDLGVPKLPSVLSPNPGGIEESLRNNIFVGAFGPGVGGSKQSEKPEEVLPFVKYDSIYFVGGKKILHLVDQGKRDPDPTKKSGSQETPLQIGGLANSVSFNILDRYDNVMNRCSVVDIQKRLVFFYTDHKFYRWEMGQSLQDGLQQPVTQVNMILGPLATVVAPKDVD